MSARIAAALVMALAVQPALADNAKERGGGSSSSSSGGGHHPSPGVSSSSSSRDSGSSGSHASSPPLTDAQRRHPRPGTGHGYYGRSGRPYYYSDNPYYYGYYPYWGYWGLGYGYGYYGYSPYSYGYGYRSRSYYRDYGSLRLLVDPEQTRVYVDGYYAGVADDFDGLFQRLQASPGRHEIALKLEGYRTHRMKVWVPPDRTIKLHHDMVRGSGEDAVEDLAGPVDRDEEETVKRAERRDRDEAYEDDTDDGRPVRGEERGELRLDIRPDDASVYVDGAFKGSGRQARSLELPVGRHRVEVVRPGFKTFDRDVEVKGGRPAELEVELERP